MKTFLYKVALCAAIASLSVMLGTLVSLIFFKEGILVFEHNPVVLIFEIFITALSIPILFMRLMQGD